jgi:pyrroline-5-carboxylate reductase
MLEQTSIASCVYIGVGHMGLPVFEATNRYFLGNGWRVLAVDRNPEKLKELPVMTETQVPRHAKLAIIGVRPQDFPALREETINAEVIVSMMAGIPCDALQAAFPDAQIIRIIPNTPCAFGVGLTPVYVQPRATPPVRLSEILTGIGCLGPLLFVAEEDMIDKATGVSAGGPAYCMYVAGAMIAAAESMGFAPSDARLLVAQTLGGSAELLLRTNKSPEQLTREVMTPNGTTERGIETLHQHDVAKSIREALLAASQRASDLSTSIAGVAR